MEEFSVESDKELLKIAEELFNELMGSANEEVPEQPGNANEEVMEESRTLKWDSVDRKKTIKEALEEMFVDDNNDELHDDMAVKHVQSVSGSTEETKTIESEQKEKISEEIPTNTIDMERDQKQDTIVEERPRKWTQCSRLTRKRLFGFQKRAHGDAPPIRIKKPRPGRRPVDLVRADLKKLDQKKEALKEANECCYGNLPKGALEFWKTRHCIRKPDSFERLNIPRIYEPGDDQLLLDVGKLVQNLVSYCIFREHRKECRAIRRLNNLDRYRAEMKAAVRKLPVRDKVEPLSKNLAFELYAKSFVLSCLRRDS
uniref:Uncharacterized protein n=1 Tax=Caenorhabditis tropicalis TaxID=1561998 RepID=A0A1I7UPN4_9PELO